MSPAAAQAQTCFKITDLGKIRGFEPPGPYGINNLNQAVFTVDVGTDLTKNHAFVYLPVGAYGLTAGCHDLHLLGDLDGLGFSTSVVHDLNDAGIAVGTAATVNGVTKAFVWRLDLAPQQFFNLATFDTGTTSAAWAINDEDPPIIVGEGNLVADCACPPQPPQNGVFVTVAYRLKLTVPPPTLLNAVKLLSDPDEECDFQTFARDLITPLPPPAPQLINVTGFSDQGGTVCEAPAPCDILKDATVWFQGAMVGTALNDQSPGGSETRGVGDNGGFCGWRFDSAMFNNCQPEAVYWHTTLANALNLGSLITPPEPSRAERINSTSMHRQVVGWANSTPDAALLWECRTGCNDLGNWTLTELNAEAVIGPCSANWLIEQAFDVNDGGVIIAWGVRTGQGRHALLLTPDPTCCPADLDGDGSVGIPDLLILLANWGACPNCGQCGAQCVADIDCDCSVGGDDEDILLAAFGPCPCAGSDGGSSADDLEEAVQAMGYDGVQDYQDWLAQASEAEALASGWVLYALLTDGQ